MKSQYGDVAVETKGHVAIATIDRPPNNHVSVELMHDLADALDAIDGEVNLRERAVLVREYPFKLARGQIQPAGGGVLAWSASSLDAR